MGIQVTVRPDEVFETTSEEAIKSLSRPILYLVVTAVLLMPGISGARLAFIQSDPSLPIQDSCIGWTDSSSADSVTRIADTAKTASRFLSGSGLRLSGYTQFRIRLFQPGEGKFSGADLRRIRFSLNGDPVDKWRYAFQVEFANAPKALDASITYSPFTNLCLTAGQFKIPFSRENLEPASRLVFIDRPQVVEALAARNTDVIGNQYGRDIGVQLSGSLAERNGTLLLEYAAGVFNGAGINTVDNNNAKDFCGRAVLHPLDGLQLGGSYYNGFDKWGTPSVSRARRRAGLEFSYEYRSLNFSGEYIAGTDGSVSRAGWYAQAGWFLVRRVLQVAARYDAFDSETALAGMTDVNYVFGANYFFAPAIKVQANYLVRREQKVRMKNDLFEMQLQLSI